MISEDDEAVSGIMHRVMGGISETDDERTLAEINAKYEQRSNMVRGEGRIQEITEFTIGYVKRIQSPESFHNSFSSLAMG